MVIAVMATKERRKLATVNGPGVYLQTNFRDETVIVKLEGQMAQLLEMTDPKTYRSYLTVEKDEKVLYAELRKVLYGILGVHYCFRRRY